ncbi:hypothetical protein [Variovorax paradoxus]|uniref:hypothetical protein n=1 Tax=Variovorax paradoxus TaxID=34073 RepID=UPI00277F157C|nr:hypothetical protein [Variovorax paradoxus]MDQ0591355.1 hypothetical protein [Variovorax paradoxus]
MTTQMHNPADFTADQRNRIEALRRDLVQRTHRTITTEYGATDCGQLWAALCVESLPEGAPGTPGPLVSILVGSGIPVGAAVMGADGSSVEPSAEFAEAIKAARFAGMREWRAMTSPHITRVH